MARGSKPGERRGGRTKGTPNKRTAKQVEEIQTYIAKQVIEAPQSGFDPVEALRGLTEWAYREFSNASDNPELKMKLGMVAADWAAKAAPYIRPRLSAVEAQVNVNVTIYERIERANQRLAIAA